MFYMDNPSLAAARAASDHSLKAAEVDQDNVGCIQQAMTHITMRL